ncbi:pimeloyl-ACP methyl ester carboxylesterase [Bradyrhizobium ottawaense]|uniref:Pimeloyl-ACP methyl ester carboxylesterase n=1 Tax=Bradyrhizobium ottawaense TaxID=931866 RepID=A0ABV4G747_9BRAD
MSIPATLALSAAMACAVVQASAQELRSSRRSISYHSVDVRDLKIFYRDAGPADAPTVLLLHGFPSSSRMWEPLLPLLADKYHVIAPDYPGFGNSSAPPPSDFTYTFDNIAGVMNELTVKLGLGNYVLFMQDYGGPVGFRMALAHPERVRGIIIQNAVSHEQGLSPLWEARRRYWADPAHELEALKANFTSLAATRQRHLGSSPHPERYDPDSWTDEYAFLTRPGQAEIQTTLFLDYRTNVASYPEWQEWLRKTRRRRWWSGANTIRPSRSPARRPIATTFRMRRFTSWKRATSRWMKPPTKSLRSFAASLRDWTGTRADSNPRGGSLRRRRRCSA